MIPVHTVTIANILNGRHCGPLTSLAFDIGAEVGKHHVRVSPDRDRSIPAIATVATRRESVDAFKRLVMVYNQAVVAIAIRKTRGNPMHDPQSMTSSTRWDYAAYASIPYDGKRHEILEGEHHVNPAPSLYHQAISRRIQFQLYTQIELPERGVVINAPVDVQLGNENIVQPDLVIITHKRRHIMTPIKVKGIPDLLVEILSPANPGHDLDTKRRVYEQMGVPEYWIVFPEEHQVLQLVLQDGKYTENTVSDAITMTREPFASVDLTKVW